MGEAAPFEVALLVEAARAPEVVAEERLPGAPGVWAHQAPHPVALMVCRLVAGVVASWGFREGLLQLARVCHLVEAAVNRAPEVLPV